MNSLSILLINSSSMGMATHVGMLCLWLLCIPICLHLASTSAQSHNYMIHMDLAAMPKAFSNQHTWYLATLSSVAASLNSDPSSVSSKLIYSYQNVMNGFSANLSPDELQALKSCPGYISSIPDMTIKHDTTHSPHFLGLNPVGGAWPVSKYGQGMIIGLVDTGIWPESPSFGDQGMSEIPSRWKGKCESGAQFDSSLCNKKLIGARFFNKGLLSQYPQAFLGVNSTRDTDGHGTHTSTTAAGSIVEGASFFGYASGFATGMAPAAHVAMYKAVWEDGAYISDIIAAIDSAIEDGVDVISMSLGLHDKSLHADPIAIATFAAMEKGIFVSASAGNNGPLLETMHNGIPWLITVAASTLDRQFHGTLTLNDQVTLTGLSLYPGNFSAAQIPLVFMGLCDDMEKLIQVRSKIVVCENVDKPTLWNQFQNLTAAKVVGGVIISNNTLVRYIFEPSPFPCIFLSVQVGEIVKNFIKSSAEPKASIVLKITDLGTAPAPCVDHYSSRGPSKSCPFVLKPDVTAPGTLILAAWPRNIPVTDWNLHEELFYNDFNLLTGTSMSCPHVAGVAALVKEAHPDWSPAAIRSAIMTTSSILDNTFGLIKDIGDDYKAATPLAVGAGHINPNRAIEPGLVYDAGIQDYVNLMCALNYTQKEIMVITRSAAYNCSNPSLDLNYPSFIAFFNASDSTSTSHATEFHRTVTHVGEGPTIYAANITEIEGFHVSVIPDTLTFMEKNQKLSYKLRIEGPTIKQEQVAFGHLSWLSMDLKYLVQSPIVVTSLNSQPLLSHS